MFTGILTMVNLLHPCVVFPVRCLTLLKVWNKEHRVGGKPMTFPYWLGGVATELFVESFVVFWLMTFYSHNGPSVRSVALFLATYCKIS